MAKQLQFPVMGVLSETDAVVEIGLDDINEKLRRSERIALECMENDEPFFVLRAKDIFAVMGVNNYSKLVDEYGPLDVEFHAAVMDVAQEMREWQMSHPERVKYPD